MNASFKAFLVVVAKNAVNAALVCLGPVISSPGNYNLTSLNGWEHIGILVGGAIASRELIVWVPVLLKWSQTNGNSNN